MELIFESLVAAPRDRVFAAHTDLQAWPDRIEGIKKIELLTEGEVGVGTRFRETRIMFKKEAVEEMTFTAFDPPHGYTLEAETCGCTFTSVHEFIEQGDKTMVRLTMTSKANTLMAKLMTPLGFLMKGTMKKAIQKDMEDMRAAIESTA